MTITSNAGSTFTHLQSYLNTATADYQKNLEQLSSGNKYTSIGDNPIAVANANKISVKIETNGTAKNNIGVGESMLTMAEDSQENIISNISRIRDLCLQAANGTYSTNDKQAILDEVKARLAYIDQSAGSTQFNNIGLLDGTASVCYLQTGTNADNRMNVGEALIDVHTSALGIDISSSTMATTWTNDDIAAFIDKLGIASDKLATASAKIGSYLYRLDTTSDSLQSLTENLTSKKSAIMDADVAEASAEMVQNQILQNASVTILTQMNNMQSLPLSLLQ